MLLRAVVVMMMAVCCLVWVFEHQPARALFSRFVNRLFFREDWFR